MKKFLQHALFRSLCVGTLGLLLLVFSSEMSLWMVYASGGLFVLLGAAAILNFLRRSPAKRPSVLYPISAVGCVLFGVVQLLLPELFSGILRYILSGVMFLLSVVQLVSLVSVRRRGIALHWTFFLYPLVGMGIAAFAAFYSGFVEHDHRALLVLGVGFVGYALLELWAVVIMKRQPRAIAPDGMAEE